MPNSAFGEGWQAAWSGDPSAARAWHISGIRASVRGERHGLPMIRLDGQRLVNRRQWDIEALRIEALAVALVGFDPLHGGSSMQMGSVDWIRPLIAVVLVAAMVMRQ